MTGSGKLSIASSNRFLSRKKLALKSITSGGQIFASDATFQEVRDIVFTAGHLNVKLKGMSQLVPIHEITGIGDCEIVRAPE